jgi:hypothetical protein
MALMLHSLVGVHKYSRRFLATGSEKDKPPGEAPLPRSAVESLFSFYGFAFERL